MRPVNPVLRRELLERWRSRRAVILLSAFLALLGGVVYLLERIGRAALNAQAGIEGPDAMATLLAGPLLGAFLVEGLLFFVLLFVLFVAPGHAAAQLVGERERRTLPLLQATLLRPWQIVAGKLGASVTWLVLLVVATVPLGATGFFLGGVAIADLLRATAFVLVVAVSVAAMGLGISAVTRRTAAAVALTYGLVLILLVGTPFVAIGEFALRAVNDPPRRPETPVALYANPFFGLADAARASRPSDTGFTRATLPSPLGIIAETLPRDTDPRPQGGVDVEERRVPAPEPAVPPQPQPPPPQAVEPAPGAAGDTAPEPDAAGVAEPIELRSDSESRARRAAPVQAPAGVGGPDPDEDRKPVWLIVAGVYAALGAAGLGLATWRVRAGDAAVPVPLRGRRRRALEPPAAWPATGGPADQGDRP